MSPAANVRIDAYSLSGTDSDIILQNALTILKPHLPVSIPLYRRLQFGRFIDATCLLSNIPLDSNPPKPLLDDSPWLIAFVDRSCRPETEVWISASWEKADSSDIPAERQKTMDELVRNAVLAMKHLPVPTSIHRDAQAEESKPIINRVEKDHAGLSIKDYGGHAADTNIMLWGAVHEKTVEILKRLSLLNYRFKAALMANYTFIWDVDSLPEPRPLPQGLRWGGLGPTHFELVKSRTQIPRQDRTLAILPNLGIFPVDVDSPISWAFVGLDASLTTLHVEPESQRNCSEREWMGFGSLTPQNWRTDMSWLEMRRVRACAGVWVGKVSGMFIG